MGILETAGRLGSPPDVALVQVSRFVQSARLTSASIHSALGRHTAVCQYPLV